MNDVVKPLESDEIRGYLTPFCASVGRAVRPAPSDETDFLVRYMAKDPEFLAIRNLIARIQVDLLKARRIGSATRASLPALESQLIQAMSDRQRIIATAVDGERYAEFRRLQIADHAKQMREWDEVQSLAVRARAVLMQDRIPTVNRPVKMGIEAVLEAVEQHVAAGPPVGSLILMGEEPRPAHADFLPISAAVSGLNPRMFSASIRLAVSLESDRGREAEASGAVVSRGALIMRLDQNRMPIDERHWRVFDDVLPLATRREMVPLIPSCVPFSSPFSTLRLLLSVESWRAIRNAANDASNGTCRYCAMPSAGEVSALWRYLEPPRGSNAFGIQRLVGVVSCCSSCAGVVFPEPGSMVVRAPNAAGYAELKKDVFEVNRVMRRLSRLNRWYEDASPDPLVTAVERAQTAYHRRSLTRWALDLTVLHGGNVALHPDVVMHRRGWIMRHGDVPIFEDGGSVHLTRIFGCSFLNADDRRYYFPVPEIYDVSWDTSAEDVWSEVARSAVPVMDGSDDDAEEPAGPLNPDEEDYDTEEGPPFSTGV